MVLIAGNCDYAIYDKGEFSDVIKLRIERERGRLSWAQYNSKNPYTRRAGGSKPEKTM